MTTLPITALPIITLSTLDHERLQLLLDKLPKPWPPEAALLEAELERADIVEPTQIAPNRVTMNSKVRFRILDSGEEHELVLSYPRDCASANDRVSVLAPIGCALLGLAVGQRIQWPLRDGRNTQLEILALSYQPERSGDLHR